MHMMGQFSSQANFHFKQLIQQREKAHYPLPYQLGLLITTQTYLCCSSQHYPPPAPPPPPPPPPPFSLCHSQTLNRSAYCKIELCIIETSDPLKLQTRIFQPEEDKDYEEIKNKILVSTGWLSRVAAELANKGYKALTFDHLGFQEIKDMIAICNGHP
ncbi:hypothetical protein L6452_24023 [Arctium lappa]|uniref:Uncharacterized protein n=1 Tax=Arctium lappa TaxID=4217 RepID=A0ACB9AAH0_ARCLA|nr:hypothetical protein L6452_24023 [Arctium lappa]